MTIFQLPKLATVNMVSREAAKDPKCNSFLKPHHDVTSFTSNPMGGVDEDVSVLSHNSEE